MNLKTIILIFAILFPLGAQAKHVTVENAQAIAHKYYSNTTEGVTLRSSQPSSFTLSYTAKREAGDINLRSEQTDSDNAYFYIFNAPDSTGFIIVAADDCAYPVLGYSFKGAFDYDKAPPVFLQWLMNYQEEIEETLNTHSTLETNPEWRKIEDGMTLRSAGTMLGTAEWSQDNPYNRLCPMIGEQRAVTGCVATAMAIVMKYHADNGFAATGTGSHSYTYNGNEYAATFGAYNWGNMPQDFAGFTNDTQRDAVALLMYHCGVSVEAEFGKDVTNAITSNIAIALPTFFGYDQSAEYIYRASFDDATWKNFITTEIDNNRPVIYSGRGSFGGHAFICEGYTVDDQYYINWGWGSYCNGYFLLNALNPDIYSFSSDQGMIIGMKKNTGLTTPHQIWLTTAGGGKGMSILQKNPLIVAAGALENFSYSLFNGRIAVALTDYIGNVKEIISPHINRSTNPLLPNYYLTITAAPCNITTTIAPTDLLRMVSSNDNGATWNIILGRTGVIDFLSVGDINVAVTSVSLNLNARTLNEGESFQLIATVAPTNATNKNITWSTSNANVAEVNASGIVTAKTAGTATITVTTTEGGYQATCAVTVTSPYLASGTTGALTWILSHEGTLTISGYGAMPDYSDMQSAPWQDYLSSIKSIVMTSGVTKIGNYAFVYCTQITSINIPTTVTDIGSYAFYHCTNLTSVSLPNTVSIIKPYTFFGCKFETLLIPNSITEIHAFAFSFCGVVSLTIPNSVTYIGIAAFSENPLTEVYVYWSYPLGLDNSPFTGVNVKAVTLQIPADTKSLYEVADVWMDFGVLFEEGSTGDKDLLSTPITVLLQGDILHVTSAFAEDITIYSLTGNILYQATKPVGSAILKVGALPKGILIVSSKSGWTRKIVKN